MSTTINFGSNESFIENYENLKSAMKMAELYNCSKSTVLKHAKKIGYDVNSNKTYKLSQEDKEYIKEHYQNMTSTELAEHFKVSRGMITKVWHDAKLSGKEHTNSGKYNLTGQVINNLTVLEKTDHRDAAGNIMWLCKCSCGKLKEVSSTRLVSGEAKSCGCLSQAALEIGRGLNFKDLTGQTFGKLTVVKRCEDKKSSTRQQVQWLCKCECGRLTKVTSNNLTRKNSQSCGLCSNNSHGNIKIETLLKQNNILFEREKHFPTCKDKSMLPFDFYIDNKYLIEYDGKQHFEKSSLFDYESTHKHDLIKSQWCKDNNIPLIRIPYTHYDDLTIKDLLLETSTFVEK